MFPILLLTAFSFDGKFDNPTLDEVWTAGKQIMIQWLPGNTPVTLPDNFPENLNIFCLKASDNSVYRQITMVNPSKWARWIYNLPTDWTSGEYKIQLCDSAKPTDCIISPKFTVKGVDVQPIPSPGTGSNKNTSNANSSDKKQKSTFNSKESLSYAYTTVLLMVAALLQ